MPSFRHASAIGPFKLNFASEIDGSRNRKRRLWYLVRRFSKVIDLDTGDSIDLLREFLYAGPVLWVQIK